MKLATLRDGSADGRLIIVSDDLKMAIAADAIAACLQQAIENWPTVEPRLRDLAAQLNAGAAPGAFVFEAGNSLAPLPRAWQWLDGSAFSNHGRLMEKAFDIAPVDQAKPLMYQGLSHRFLSCTEDVRLPTEEDGIDFEAEFGVVTDFVPMGTAAVDALSHIKLLVLINDWSLRVTGAAEMRTGFGWVQAKPACALGPVAVTPDTLGAAWSDGRADLVMAVDVNGQRFGRVRSNEMAYGFHELIAHAARTRDLPAGTIIGSGTISSSDYAAAGSCCLAERRAIEMIETGVARTPFLRFGDQVSISTLPSAFGRLDQRVLPPQ